MRGKVAVFDVHFAEVDIGLPPDMPLQEAHDIGEDLQIKIERMEEVIAIP